ncbi:hypothetical protein DL769_005526 [Monosporascus sp. CRB-8-3]|nr:hypothetical protein DL769_005526 [Monosporascus sp. CRB-8-3]
MVRTKRVPPGTSDTETRNSPRKRGRTEDEEPYRGTPAKRRNTHARTDERASGLTNGNPSDYDFPSGEDSGGDETQQEGAMKKTPSKRNKHHPDTNGEAATPGSRKGKVKDGNVETPSKATPSRLRGTPKGETPRWRRNDRSARKKSARALIEKVVAGDTSDEEEDEVIARQIYESSEEVDEESSETEERAGELEEPSEAATPSKTPGGRKKKTLTRKRRKSPTPPRDLPPHEVYFAQNRPGRAKTSNNTLASLQLLTHEEFFSTLHKYKNPHAEDIEFLQSIHIESFPQWIFELSQGFSVCLYGYGAKRSLLNKFAQYIYDKSPDRDTHKIVIVNGYIHRTSLREILGTIASAVDRFHKLPAGNPSAMLDNLKALLSSHGVRVTVILNSIDAHPMRRAGVQPVLAQLAAHPRVQLICSADTPDFALLWDSTLRSSFNFTFHDCTTFVPFAAEMADPVDEVHELLGRRARRVGGREGVAYVLRSLPENAKNLFRLLLGEVLVAMDDNGDVGAGGENPGVEYRMLYNKAVEEFICSSEMAFRTLLKEFHDHQMIASRKDVLGTELLSVPFRKEELESILEELMP